MSEIFFLADTKSGVRAVSTAQKYSNIVYSVGVIFYHSTFAHTVLHVKCVLCI